METIDLIDAYGARNIEGVDVSDVFDALCETPGAFSVSGSSGKVALVHEASGKTIHLSCVYKYFFPEKDYYRPNHTDSCAFICRAMGLPQCWRYACRDCFMKCIEAKRRVRPSRISVSQDYFFK